MSSSVTRQLAHLIAIYLRERRTAADLTQVQLAERSRGRAGEFDHTWISQWELLGPKEGIIKAFTYLSLVGADLEMIGELLQLEIALPEFEQEPTIAEAIANAEKFGKAYDLPFALAWSLWAAIRAEQNVDPANGAAAWLLFSIAAKRAEAERVSEFAAHRVLALAENSNVAPQVVSRAVIQAATLAIRRGDTPRGEELLDQLTTESNHSTPDVSATVSDARGYLASERNDAPAALAHYRTALALYPPSLQSIFGARVKACIAMAQAQLGPPPAGLDTLDEALTEAQSGSPMTRLIVGELAARTHGYRNEHATAVQHLSVAEELARELKLTRKLFEIRLELVAAATKSMNEPLAALMTRRVTIDRRRLVLSPRLIRKYESVMAARKAKTT
jgi:tetratricopeptide (TPR) repeat protein